uniref:Uncharacterized protein n=1 Tax=Romanomermis culicivorax TaxID=13658 RepID=A0A915JCS2_ROMCU
EKIIKTSSARQRTLTEALLLAIGRRLTGRALRCGAPRYVLRVHRYAPKTKKYTKAYERSAEPRMRAPSARRIPSSNFTYQQGKKSIFSDEEIFFSPVANRGKDP